MKVGIANVESRLSWKFNLGRRNNVIGIVTRLRAGRQGILVPFPAGASDIFGLLNSQTGSETHQTSYLMATGEFFWSSAVWILKLATVSSIPDLTFVELFLHYPVCMFCLHWDSFTLLYVILLCYTLWFWYANKPRLVCSSNGAFLKIALRI
jgi:hypothetical protein